MVGDRGVGEWWGVGVSGGRGLGGWVVGGGRVGG